MLGKALPMEFSRASRQAASTAHQSGPTAHHHHKAGLHSATANDHPGTSAGGGVTAYQTIAAGGASQGGLAQSNSLAIMNSTNSKSLIEQGAVAAVVP